MPSASPGLYGSLITSAPLIIIKISLLFVILWRVEVEFGAEGFEAIILMISSLIQAPLLRDRM